VPSAFGAFCFTPFDGGFNVDGSFSFDGSSADFDASVDAAPGEDSPRSIGDAAVDGQSD